MPHSAPIDLLSELLGPAVTQLDESVRLAHRTPVRARGRFDVEPAPHFAGRLLARCWGLPRPGKAVETQVRVSGEGKGQRWSRTFGAQSLVTHQKADAGLLVESKGIGRVGMKLAVMDRGLRYETVAAWIGWLSVPISLVPCITAEVQPAPPGWRVSVTVRVGVLGVICRYSGKMEPY